MLHSTSDKHAAEAACCLQNLAVSSNEMKMLIAGTDNLLEGLVKLMSPRDARSEGMSSETTLQVIRPCDVARGRCW